MSDQPTKVTRYRYYTAHGPLHGAADITEPDSRPWRCDADDQRFEAPAGEYRLATDAEHTALVEAETELDAVMYLAVEKWFDEVPPGLNRATLAGKAREIALQAIEEARRERDELRGLVDERDSTLAGMQATMEAQGRLHRKSRELLERIQTTLEAHTPLMYDEMIADIDGHLSGVEE